MKIDSSNKSDSLIIAGILVFLITSIFVAFIIRFGDYSLNTEVNTNPEEVYSERFVFKHNSSELETDDVHIAQSCVLEDLDTEPGEITIEDYYYDDPLPLCVTPEVLSDWFVLVKSVGGYVPTGGDIQFWQKGELIWNDCYGNGHQMYLGYGIDVEDVTDIYGTAPCCCARWYNLTIDTSCENWACIDSNQYPPVCEGCTITDFEEGMTIPDKEVDVYIWMDWEGCPMPSQEFEIIYAHKSYVLGVPNSQFKFKITLPVDSIIINIPFKIAV